MGLEDLRKNLAVKKASSQTSRDAWYDGMVVDPLFASAALYAVKNGSISLVDLAANFHIDSVRSNKILSQLVEYHVIFSSGKKWLVCMPKDMLEKYLVRYIRKYQDEPNMVSDVGQKEPEQVFIVSPKNDIHKKTKTLVVNEIYTNTENSVGSAVKTGSRDSIDKIEWKNKFRNLSTISAYLPGVLKWCGMMDVLDPSLAPYNITITKGAVHNCITQMRSLGLLDSKSNILIQYRSLLVELAGIAYAECIRRKYNMPTEATFLYSKSYTTKSMVVGPYVESKQKQILPQSNVLPSWSDVQSMTGVQFEDYCMSLLKRDGFTNVRGTVTSGDGGVDILAERSGELYAIQCKRWKGSVGYKAVQEIYSGCALENADKAVVMTNSHFSQPARDNARKLGVLLWDGKYIESLANSVVQKESEQDIQKAKKFTIFGAIASVMKGSSKHGKDGDVL